MQKNLKDYVHTVHPLVFIQEWSRSSDEEEEEEACCFTCKERVEGPSYCCRGCKFYLHKTCGDLEVVLEIVNHPLHPSHPLIFLPKSPYRGNYLCDLCGESFSGTLYHCDSCGFDLDITCALLLKNENFHKLEHRFHKHPLTVIEKYTRKVDGRCNACRKDLSTPTYKCFDCNKFGLHKECAELPLVMNHPFHAQHPLTLLTKSLSSSANHCNFCHWSIGGFVYHCGLCMFQLDIDCALLLHQLFIAGNFPKLEHFAHDHPLILIEKHNKIIQGDCFGCRKELSTSPIYKCFDCWDVCLHKECAELPPQINHPSDRKHPLTLLQNPPIHSNTCSCYYCKIQWKGVVYYCSPCKFGLMLEDVSPPPVIKDTSHEHPWILISRPMSFICDFCGTDGDRTPYMCTTCNLIVHKNCTSLPRRISIMRHGHPICHSYSFRENQFENWECRICYKRVDPGYGSYFCSIPKCNYIAHVNCATDKNIWDGSVVPENEDGMSKGESTNLITEIIQKKGEGEDAIAMKIKHAYHDHNLILVSNELPKMKRNPSHKHMLTLQMIPRKYFFRMEGIFGICDACDRLHQGFHYSCREKSCRFSIDIQCSLLSNSFSHPSHEHPLFLDHNYKGNCSACGNQIGEHFGLIPSLGYRCVRGCEFFLDFACLTLPEKAWYKYDKHSLTLTYHDGSDPNQSYCDICEEKRDPNKWFYCCADCDNTVHPECILGDLPFIKLGTTFKSYIHPHLLTFVKKTWNCPPCNVCKKLCNGQALECKESGCNFISHWNCLFPV
ncbi:hypothetical protein REPUB_Repub16aG0147100 [Reevesia pubescens]